MVFFNLLIFGVFAYAQLTITDLFQNAIVVNIFSYLKIIKQTKERMINGFVLFFFNFFLLCLIQLEYFKFVPYIL